MVLHVMNSPSGGSALSTLALIDQFKRQDILGCAVCDTGGMVGDRTALADAVDGRVVFAKLYWTNHKIRSAPWKRPIHEARQLLQTRFQRGSTSRVVALARQHRVDLIHTNTIVTSEGGMAARQLGLPHVWHLRELIGPGQPLRMPFEGARLAPFIARYCSKLIANSEASAAQVRDLLPPGYLEVVSNGIDLSRFHPRGVRDSGRVVVAMVASLTSRMKKHDLFVAAAAQVDRSLPIEWRIYGHDPSHGGTRHGDAYTDAIHDQIARAGLADRFTWPGFVGDQAQIMGEIDLLVHSADNESFGRVVVEAMAAGLPVVGVRGGGVGEIVEHGQTGYVAERDDPQDLAAGIEQLVRDPQRRAAMGEAGRKRAEQKYSLEACAAGVMKVYEQALTRPLGQPATTHA
jgi:glycosyltransferase involved in cell wall biosynthesis